MQQTTTDERPAASLALVPTTDQILGDSKEITDAYGFRFKIFVSKES